MTLVHKELLRELQDYAQTAPTVESAMERMAKRRLRQGDRQLLGKGIASRTF